MAYEGVNANKLKIALQNIEPVIENKKEIDNVINSFSEGDWSGETLKRIREALYLVADEYKKIDEYIEKCKEAANYIEEYKKLDGQNKLYQSKVDQKNKKIDRAEEQEDTTSLENEIKRYKNSIASNNSRKNELKIKIENLIN